MIAKKVYEYLGFERGIDPKTAMGIGQVQILADLWKKFEKEYGQNLANLEKRDNGTFLKVNATRGGVMKCFDKMKKVFGTKWFIWNENYTTLPHVYFRIKPEFEDLFNKAYTLVLNSTNESINFKRGDNPHKSLRIGKYRSVPRTFENSTGEKITIDVIDNTFTIADMEVRLEFTEDPDGTEFATVSVDGQKNDYQVFKIEPFDYEFKEQGKYADPGYTGYGMPIARDAEHLKELKEKHSYWTSISGDYSRESKDPFVAVAKLVLSTY